MGKEKKEPTYSKKEPINITEMVVNENILSIQVVIDRLQQMDYMSQRDADTVLDLVDAQSTLAGFSQFIRTANRALSNQQGLIQQLNNKISMLQAELNVK